MTTSGYIFRSEDSEIATNSPANPQSSYGYFCGVSEQSVTFQSLHRAKSITGGSH